MGLRRAQGWRSCGRSPASTTQAASAVDATAADAGVEHHGQCGEGTTCSRPASYGSIRRQFSGREFARWSCQHSRVAGRLPRFSQFASDELPQHRAVGWSSTNAKPPADSWHGWHCCASHSWYHTNAWHDQCGWSHWYDTDAWPRRYVPTRFDGWFANSIGRFLAIFAWHAKLQCRLAQLRSASKRQRSQRSSSVPADRAKTKLALTVGRWPWW